MLVYNDTPTLIAPLLGTPTSVNLANATNLPISAIASLGTGIGTWLGTPSISNFFAALTGEASGVETFLTTPSIANFFAMLTGEASGVETFLTTPTIANFFALMTGEGSGVETFLTTPSSANFFSMVTGESGSGAVVGGTAPTITGGTITALTTLAIRDTSAAFDVIIAAVSSAALSADRTLTLNMGNAARSLKLQPLDSFSNLADGSSGNVLTTLGTNLGYAWAAALTSTLASTHVFVGNGSNVATDVALSGGATLSNAGVVTLRAADQTTNGAVTSFVPVVKSGIKAVSSADYTVLDGDGYQIISVTTAASDRTITLPTAADNTGRTINIKKADSGAGHVIVDGEGSETIDGALTQTLFTIYGRMTIICDGATWQILQLEESGTYTAAFAYIANPATGNPTSQTAQFYRVGNRVTVAGSVDIDPTTAVATLTRVSIALPIASALSDERQLSGTGIGDGTVYEADRIYGNAAGDNAFLDFLCADAANKTHSFHFTYQVL